MHKPSAPAKRLEIYGVGSGNRQLDTLCILTHWKVAKNATVLQKIPQTNQETSWLRIKAVMQRIASLLLLCCLIVTKLANSLNP